MKPLRPTPPADPACRAPPPEGYRTAWWEWVVVAVLTAVMLVPVLWLVFG